MVFDSRKTAMKINVPSLMLNWVLQGVVVNHEHDADEYIHEEHEKLMSGRWCIV
jgi:hypothetical protein